MTPVLSCLCDQSAGLCISSHAHSPIKLCLFSPQHHNIELSGPGRVHHPGWDRNHMYPIGKSAWLIVYSTVMRNSFQLCQAVLIVPALWLECELLFIQVKVNRILLKMCQVVLNVPAFWLECELYLIKLPLCSISAWIAGDAIGYLFTVLIYWNYPCQFI